MKYFFDTEFIEDGKTIDLISIGMVAEDGREFYAQRRNCDYNKASSWVRENVFPTLKHFDVVNARPSCEPVRFSLRTPLDKCYQDDCPYVGQTLLGPQIRYFVGAERYGEPEFWAYFGDYDWVALCQIYGTMMQLPKDWPKHAKDLKQEMGPLKRSSLPQQAEGIHNALADAHWNKQVYDYLISNKFANLQRV